MSINILKKLLLFLIIIFFINILCISQEDEEINLNFINTDLELFINFVAKQTNKRILYDSSIRGRKIYLVSSTPVSKKDLFKIFLSVMEYNGYILETTGKGDSELIKIKRNIQGPWTQTKTIYTEEELEQIKEQDQFITMVIKLKYISAREVQTTLRALRIVNPQGGNLAGIEGSNTILITDFAPNVKRIYDVIKMMDQQGPEKEFKVIELKYAIADEIAEKLKDFLTKGNRITPGIGFGPNLEEVKITTDRRLNAVIVQAYPEKMKQVVNLIKELDKEVKNEPSNIHYIRLKHADAVKLQETLSKLLEGGTLTKKRTQVGRGPIPSGPKFKTIIQAEPQTNSLIVKADTRDWKEIEKIIKQVDVRRPQVLIEGALIELSPEDVLGLGIELFWADEAADDKVRFGGGSDFGFSNLVVVDKNGDAKVIDDSTDNITDAKKFGKIPVSSRADFQRGAAAFLTYDDLFTLPLLLRAMKKEGSFKVLSIPSVLTNDNERALIKVADAAPSRTSTENNSGSRTDTFGGFQEAGTTLVITPHISGEKNYLRLDISQSIDEFDWSQNLIVGGVPPKRVRKITTSITVPDGHTVAIGGFTFDSQSETIEKIPLLGDLPLIGILFQTRVITHRKRNIYLFLTPHILRDENFKDLFHQSYIYKMKAHKLGANIKAIDSSFSSFREKYQLNDEKNSLPPIYKIKYRKK